MEFSNAPGETLVHTHTLKLFPKNPNANFALRNCASNYKQAAKFFAPQGKKVYALQTDSGQSFPFAYEMLLVVRRGD